MAFCTILQSNTFRSIAVCVWLLMVGSAAREQSPCKFIPNTISLSCPCTISWSQILWLHNLRQFQDTCTRDKGNELHCQIANEARVEADRVILNYTRVIPRTVYCEISNNTSVTVGVCVPVVVLLFLWCGMCGS
ncbi:uncharacterized protein [Mobula birostris]|uniref:uncharacterized protein isoform X2 n=1 Tax=Mobula birostris TaxID=1983395 RepID=UPI003B27C40B